MEVRRADPVHRETSRGNRRQRRKPPSPDRVLSVAPYTDTTRSGVYTHIHTYRILDRSRNRKRTKEAKRRPVTSLDLGSACAYPSSTAYARGHTELSRDPATLFLVIRNDLVNPVVAVFFALVHPLSFSCSASRQHLVLTQMDVDLYKTCMR
jgi:hypothetical protein